MHSKFCLCWICLKPRNRDFLVVPIVGIGRLFLFLDGAAAGDVWGLALVVENIDEARERMLVHSTNKINDQWKLAVDGA